MPRPPRVPPEPNTQKTTALLNEERQRQVSTPVHRIEVEEQAPSSRSVPEHLPSPSRRSLTGVKTPAGDDPVAKAWVSYIRPADRPDAGLGEKEEQEARKQRFTESLKRFLDAANFLEVTTARQFRNLGISHRSYFYWVAAVRNGESLRCLDHIDYKLWLVWKSLEIARLRFQSEESVRSWFFSPNRLLSNSSTRTEESWLRPIDLLFDYDIRRRPRVLRVLLEDGT